MALEQLNVHASFHAFVNAYISQVTKISKQLINSTSDNIDSYCIFTFVISVPGTMLLYIFKGKTNISTRLNVDDKW